MREYDAFPVQEGAMTAAGLMSQPGNAEKRSRRFAIAAVGLAFVATLALSAHVGASDVWPGDASAVWLVVFALLAVWFHSEIYYRWADIALTNKASIAIGCIFALAIFFGNGITTSGSVSFLVPSVKNLLVGLVCLAGYASLSIPICGGGVVMAR